jgi:hypothetical protein
MFGMTTGLVIYADPKKEPEAFVFSSENSLAEIQAKVGGYIDSVKTQAINEADDTQMVLVGYVHDEGRILDMPLNPLASIVFNRELVGDVVLVNGTNPENGDYDGENYDLPLDFINYIMHMHPEVVRMLQFSKGLSSSVALAYRAGVVTKEELEYVMDYADKAQQNGEFMAAVDSVPERFQEILRRSVNYLNDLTKGIGDE